MFKSMTARIVPLALFVSIVSLVGAGEISIGSRAPAKTVQGDLTLTQAVELSLRQNPEMLKQLAEIERTRGLIIEARAEALPHIGVTATYDQQDKRLLEIRNNTSSGGAQSLEIPIGSGPDAQVIDLGALLASDSNSNDFRFAQDKTWQVTFQATQTLYSGGRIKAAIDIARLTEDSSYWQLRDVIDRVVATTRSQFYAALTTRSLITFAEETVKLQEDLLKDQKNRFEAGTVPRFNVLRAEVELANVVPNLIRARNDYLIAQINLAKTMGLDPGPGGKPAFSPVGNLTVSPRPFNVVEALELAKARRPFLKVQRQQIKVQAANIRIAAAGYQPTIQAHGGYLFKNSRLTDDIESSVDGWFLGVTGSWDIFDGLATYGRVKQAKAQLESATVNYADSVQQVELEVQQAYANLITQRETIKSQQKNVEQAVEALRLANERLSAGAGTQLEVLDARVALTRARSTEVLARGDYNTALAEFDRATATDTIYAESFRDPLRKIEQRVLGTKVESDTRRAEPEGKKVEPAKKPAAAPAPPKAAPASKKNTS
jgi:outer membrane protein